jgi:hypothetical protein
MNYGESVPDQESMFSSHAYVLMQPFHQFIIDGIVPQ